MKNKLESIDAEFEDRRRKRQQSEEAWRSLH
jgi:hypothetical protein